MSMGPDSTVFVPSLVNPVLPLTTGPNPADFTPAFEQAKTADENASGSNESPKNVRQSNGDLGDITNFQHLIAPKFFALNEQQSAGPKTLPDDSETSFTATPKGGLEGQLQRLFGNARGGLYTADQIKAALDEIALEEEGASVIDEMVTGVALPYSMEETQGGAVVASNSIGGKPPVPPGRPPAPPAGPAGEGPEPDPYAHVQQGDVAGALREILRFGDPDGVLFGRRAEPLTDSQITRIDGLTAKLENRGVQPEIVAAIEQSLAAQPSRQRNGSLNALEKLAALSQREFKPILRLLNDVEIAGNPTAGEAQALASVVENLAPLGTAERNKVFRLHGDLESVIYRSNSPFVSSETKAWMLSDAAALSSKDRAYFTTRVGDLNLPQLKSMVDYTGSYGARIQARMVDALIWMERPDRSTAGKIVLTLGEVESADQVNARWNPAATPLSAEQRTEMPELMRTLAEIFDRSNMPPVLSNLAPDAQALSLVDQAASPLIWRGVQAMHVANGVTAAAQAIVGLVEQKATEAASQLAAGGSPDQPIPVKLSVLIGTGFNVGPRLDDDGQPLPGNIPLPETDGPPGAGGLAKRLRAADGQVVPIRIRNGDENAEPCYVRLEVDVHYVVDGANQPVQQAVNQSLDVDATIHVFSASNAAAADNEAIQLLSEVNPDVFILGEHPGRNNTGDNQNMRGVSVQSVNAPIDAVLAAANRQGILSIAVGDGGNEGGMADVVVFMPRNVLRYRGYVNGTDLPATDIFTAGGGRNPLGGAQFAVTSSVSNWGLEDIGGAFLRALGLVGLMPTPDLAQTAILAAGRAGAVDGVLRASPGAVVNGQTAGADGLSPLASVGRGYISRYAFNSPDFEAAAQGPRLTNWREAFNVWQALGNLQANHPDDQGIVYDTLLRRAIPPDALPALTSPPPAPVTPSGALAVAEPAETTPSARGFLSRVVHSPLTSFAGTLVLTASLSVVVDPRYLAVGNALGFLLRGVGTAFPLISSRINARFISAWNGVTLVLNGAYHNYATWSFNPAHWNWRSQPHNAGYAVTDEMSGAQRLSEAVTGETYRPAKVEQYALQATLNTANAFLMVNYSIPAGPGAVAPTIFFGGGAVYLFGKMATLDALAQIEGSSAVPQRIRDTAATLRQKIEAVNEHRIPQWAIALGLVGFGTDYLFRNALPKVITAAPHLPLNSAAIAGAYPALLVAGYTANFVTRRVRTAITARNGALAFPNPAAGTAAGLFKKDTSISLTGDADTDGQGNVWVKVTGTALGGNELTGWINVKDIGHVSITGPTGAALYAEPSSPQTPDIILAEDTQLTPTGQVQRDTDSGDVWVEVNLTNQAGEIITRWIEGGTISRGPAPPDPNGISPV
jgi:hypothetical protein